MTDTLDAIDRCERFFAKASWPHVERCGNPGARYVTVDDEKMLLCESCAEDAEHYLRGGA